MSILYCHNCGTAIDTDFDAEHFDECKAPNPGSEEAGKLGCTCAVLDNGHGDDELGKIRGFYITQGCPVHAAGTTNE